MTAAMQGSQLENPLIVSDKNRGGDRKDRWQKKLKKERNWMARKRMNGTSIEGRRDLKRSSFRGHWFGAAGGEQDVTHLFFQVPAVAVLAHLGV